VIRYFPTAGDQHGWAIDEDLRLIRRALRGVAAESMLGRADVVHAPFWLPLALHDPGVLRGKFVIAQADNPPFFYLTQPEFAWGQVMVDLWVARSTEAQEQFEALGLASVHIPYAIDTGLFFPMEDKASLRRKYGLPDDVYVIGNFHRDSEGADLTQPKRQKSPEMMVAILRRLRSRGKKFHVLLAGPRRHWIRRTLVAEGMPFTFVGKQGIEDDDFAVNILSRAQLNELYNACDLYLIPSRWEGGPQSAMEAAAARTKILSLPLGVARDILAPESLFDLASEAADKIVRDMEEGSLSATLDQQAERVLRVHSAEAMAARLQDLYGALPENTRFREKASKHRRVLADTMRDFSWQLKRRIAKPSRPAAVRIAHEAGHDEFLDEAMVNLLEVLSAVGVATDGHGDIPVIAGWHPDPADYRVLPVGGRGAVVHPGTCHIALSVQDAVNFRQVERGASVLVCPLIFASHERNHSVCPIDREDATASLRIRRAILAGRPVVYPRDSAHYYQVFHGGLPYDDQRCDDEAQRLAESQAVEIADLAKPTGREAAVGFWQTLLAHRGVRHG
jgi:glycosyltransferase involved in cell wall biosynthesis